MRFDRHTLETTVVTAHRRKASRKSWNGTDGPAGQRIIYRCRSFNVSTGVSLLYTHDTGHHTSGWWKNPDFERCMHLSVSLRDPFTGEAAPFKTKAGDKWAKAFFGDHINKVWIEPPYAQTETGVEVYHYRLFCDAGWRPMKPRGEVYSREHTPAHWKSWSDLHAISGFGRNK